MQFVGTREKATQYGDVFVTNDQWAGGTDDPEYRGEGLTGWNVLRIGLTVGMRECPCTLGNLGDTYGRGMTTQEEAILYAKKYVGEI